MNALGIAVRYATKTVKNAVSFHYQILCFVLNRNLTVQLFMFLSFCDYFGQTIDALQKASWKDSNYLKHSMNLAQQRNAPLPCIRDV